MYVPAAGSTRTCIHTPGAAFQPEEMHPKLINEALRDAALVYFDGRLAEAAILLARAARAAGVPVLVEGERLRPGLQELLAEADYVVTSAHFPQVRHIGNLSHAAPPPAVRGGMGRVWCLLSAVDHFVWQGGLQAESDTALRKPCLTSTYSRHRTGISAQPLLLHADPSL